MRSQDRGQTAERRSPVAEKSEVQPAIEAAERVFERPVVRRLGALPNVTTAFGGSFTP